MTVQVPLIVSKLLWPPSWLGRSPVSRILASIEHTLQPLLHCATLGSRHIRSISPTFNSR